MQFKSLDFRFNGINSKGKKLKIVSIDSRNNENLFGVQQNVIEEDNNNSDIPLFLGVKKKCPTFSITIMKMNEYNRPLPYDEGEFDEICRWLIQDEYKPFISWDNTGIVYYVIFTKSNDFENCAKEGYIKLDVKLSAPYAYSNQLIDYYRVMGSKIVDLYNGSNLSKFIYPDLEFELLDDCTSVTIENLTLNQVMHFENLNKKDVIYVYNKDLKDVMSKVNKNRNVFKNFNKEWIKLVYGKNRIKITGKVKIRFITQYPIGLK